MKTIYLPFFFPPFLGIAPLPAGTQGTIPETHIFDLIYYSKTKEAIKYISANKELINYVTNSKGYTLLEQAVRYHQEEITAFLLCSGAKKSATPEVIELINSRYPDLLNSFSSITFSLYLDESQETQIDVAGDSIDSGCTCNIL